MKSLRFAVTGLVRQPTRTLLGVLGIAAIGALLFDMLLLSRGLVVSFRARLDAIGFDVRVMATDAIPLTGPDLSDVPSTMARLTALPEIASAVPLRVGSARAERPPTDGGPATKAQERVDAPSQVSTSLVGAALEGSAGRRPWTVRTGTDLDGRSAVEPPVLLNERLATRLALGIGERFELRGNCGAEASAAPPVRVRVAGLAEFPFESATQLTVAIASPDFGRVCPTAPDDRADVILVATRPASEPDGTVAAIRRTMPDVHAFTNEELVARFEQRDFSYFRQISAVLATVTVFFGFLLVTVLLTVSVNQRFGEIAMLRAVGFSRVRVVLDVFWESVLLVGLGGALAVPVGFVMARWLDAILKAIPGLPADVHFFVFEPRALLWHVALLAVAALGAAAYPMALVSRLPIAATLRREVVS
ncbi:MAG: ABC transporter permease [Vicinamibacterales bacterium]